MEEKVRNMNRVLLSKTYIEGDVDKAYEICAMDDEIDELYGSIFGELLKGVKLDDSKANKSAQLLFVTKYLERIADHVTNICEWTIFSKREHM